MRFCISLLFLAGAAYVGLFVWSIFGSTGHESTRHVRVHVDSANRMASLEALAAEGLIDELSLTKLAVLLLSPGVEFSSRSHLFQPGMSARELIRRLSDQGGGQRVKVTIPEGWAQWDVAERLEEKGVCSAAAFLRSAQDPLLLSELQINGPNIEGYLFPATYPLALDAPPKQVLRTLVNETRKRLIRLSQAETPHEDLRSLGFSEFQVLTLASIVEKETGKDAERARIARVFLNRLLQPQSATIGRLQSDPTAIYGCRLLPDTIPSCAQFSGRATPSMLADSQNPYNTYRHAGLPPGPISNPGSEAILAVLHPAEGKELFFVANGRGGHTFTETFEDHKKAIQQAKSQP